MGTLELGVIGNCQVSALVDMFGRYVWACLPRLDGDPVFCSLLRQDTPGDEHGLFAIELTGEVRVEQVYERNTAILITTLMNSEGARVRITDFCPRFRQYGRNFRPVMIIRIVEPLAGHVVIRPRLRPLSDYGAASATRYLGSNHVRFESKSMIWRVSTDMSLNALLEERLVVLREPASFVMGVDETVGENIGALAKRFLEETRRYWREWTRELAIPFEWQAAVIRAAITLKLCSFEDSGAVLAALTTSIPEAANSGRNWDYRFCWLRDSYFTIHALNRLGATKTMEGYLQYINNVFAAANDRPLQPVYGISGEPELAEIIVSKLPGYRGMGPVRCGNQAYEQTQHDVYGAAILAATQTFFDQRLANLGNAAVFEQLESAGEDCWKHYDKPDAGIWEFRGRTRVHTFSSVMCWAGVDRLVRIARHLQLFDREEFWRKRANSMREQIMAASWNSQLKTFTEGWETSTVDASVLLLADLDFVAADDPKFIATVDYLGGHLRRGNYLLRYVERDDFGVPQNAFNICTFWYINALAAIGRKEEARNLFENMLARCNHLGMLSEDLDPATGELWGNFPQTYSMVGIVNSAMRLSCSWEDAL
ncbi:MAG TPA: glycoside hydrolase family 15 protein [Steroidobacteraceae bacterium]|nr:glycoside hydrolase family 15 protein [Steroidobacteraceae bacterium]